VSELPEELASYRHQVARRLNIVAGNTLEKGKGRARRRVHALTADTGLHVGLIIENGELVPKVRCMYCNLNNEAVLAGRNYHTPDRIRETPMKRLSMSMIYLCTAHDHHLETENLPRHFLSRKNVLV
jgi:hypothetical protein